MIDYFEVHTRDSAARVGELRLPNSVTAPAVVDDVLADTGSPWAAEHELPDDSDDMLTMLPHHSLPAGNADEVRESFSMVYPGVDFPSTATITTDTADGSGADTCVLSDAQGSVSHARAFHDDVIEAKENLSADTALVLSGVATPRNVSLLVYAGIDLVDEKPARARGLEGSYLASDGEYFLEDLDELSYAYEACHKPASEFTHANAVDHNANALRAEFAQARRRVRSGRPRDYVEGQVRHGQWLTALFRRFDQQHSFVKRRVPVIRDSRLTMTPEKSIGRVETQRFADRVTKHYCNCFDNPPVLLPCSAKKPHSESQSHRQFQKAVQYRARMVSIASPIGVIPWELELAYPTQHCDSVITGNWSEGEKSFVAEMLRHYLGRNGYPWVIAHFPPGAYTDIVERITDDLDPGVEFTTSEHPTTTESIGNLMRTLDDELKLTREEREHSVVKALADYRLGPSVSDALFSNVALEMTSRYPKLQVWDDVSVQLTMMVLQYGALSFTLKSAKVWRGSDAPTETVEIDGFVPHGSVLAPGVTGADEDIHPGDEVIVEGPKTFAIGRAETGGRGLVKSTRGIGVEIRHVEER